MLNTFILIKKLYYLQYTFENYSQKCKKFELRTFIKKNIDEIKKRKKLSKTIQFSKTEKNGLKTRDCLITSIN